MLVAIKRENLYILYLHNFMKVCTTKLISYDMFGGDKGQAKNLDYIIL